MLSVDGSMAAIDLGSRVVRVNASKIHKEEDPFGDVEIPLQVEDAAPAAEASGSQDAAIVASGNENQRSIPDGSTSFANVLWEVISKGKIHFLELFSGSARLSQCSALAGLKTGQPVDLRTGFDLNDPAGQKKRR